MSTPGLSIENQETFLSTLQPADANICPMGGEHESASKFHAFEIYEQRDGERLSTSVYCCRKCSALYYKS